MTLIFKRIIFPGYYFIVSFQNLIRHFINKRILVIKIEEY